MKKLAMILGVVILVIAVLGYFLAYLPYTRIRANVSVLITSAQNLKAAAKQNNIDILNEKLNTFIKQYGEFKKEAQSVYWALFIPYVSDFKNGVNAGTYLLQAARDSLDAITPYADLIGFKKGASTFSEKSAEDRLQTAVLTLDKVLGKLDKISADIKNAEELIVKIDPKRYPEKLGKTEVRSKLVNIKEQFAGLSSLFVDAKPLLKNIPNILGKDREKMYLILFQNDKEQRATGGFLTAYALFRINNGKMRIEKSDDIYTLDASIAQHPAAPREIATYHKGVSQFFIRDSNLSPDFVKSLALFNTLYSKSGAKVNYDGVITIDTKILVDMLTIFGDTEADGVVFSAKIDPHCDCPQVIYKLFDMVDRPVNYVKTNRKGILGDLMFVLFHKALGFSPSKYWGTLAQTMFTNLDKKHILLNFTDPEIQLAAEKLDYAGRITDYSSDYLHVNNVNFAGAKSNLFVNKIITSVTKMNGKNGIERTVTIELRNPYPASDCNLERGGLCLNATLRDWARLYVPEGSKLVNFEGSQKKVQTYDELGKTVFEGFMTVDPLGKATAVITYTLPPRISKDNYSLMVQKQPGEDMLKMSVEIDGKKVFTGPLEMDLELK